MNGTLTRREFCARVGTATVGAITAAPHTFGVENQTAMTAACAISPLFQTLWLPTLDEKSTTLRRIQDRFRRGELPATVVLRGESSVLPQRAAAFARSLIAFGMNPLVRADAHRTFSVRPLEKIAPNTLAERRDGLPAAIIFLDPVRGVWSRYVSVRDISAADFSRSGERRLRPTTDRLRLACRIDLAMKARS